MESKLLEVLDNCDLIGLRELLKNGIDVNKEYNIRGVTWNILLYAFDNRTRVNNELNMKIFNELLVGKSNIYYEIKDKSTTILNYIIESKELDYIKIILEHCSKINHKDENGNTPLLIALKDTKSRFRNEIIQEILKKNPDLNIKDNNEDSPLILEIKNNYKSFIDELLDHKPDLNMKDKNGNTPLMLTLQIIKSWC